MLLYLIHVLLCLVVCLTFLPSHLSLKHVLYIRYVYIIQLQCMIIYLICTCIYYIDLLSFFLLRYFQALSRNEVPPVKDRLELPSLDERLGGLTKGALSVLHKQVHSSLSETKTYFCHSLCIYSSGTLCRNLCQRGMMNGALIFFTLTYIIIIILNGKNPGGGN